MSALIVSPSPSPTPTPCESTPPSREPDRRGETARLLDEAASCRGAARQALLDQVVELNLGVARSLAHRYSGRGVDDDDLVQVANLALTRAAGTFDPTRKRDFLTFAVPSIKGELKKHFRDQGWMIRPPRRIQELQGAISRAQADLTQSLGRSPRPREIAGHLGRSLDDVVEALSSDGCFTPTSLDLPSQRDHDTGQTLGDLLGSEDSNHLEAEARLMLRTVVPRLGERDRQILRLRFFEQRTQQEIADEIGVTQMQVSRLLTRILADLRGLLGTPASPNAA